MKKLWMISILAFGLPLAGFAGQGCSAQPYVAPFWPLCTGNQGRCVVFVALGSGESTECLSTQFTATCNRYDSTGVLILQKYEYCFDL